MSQQTAEPIKCLQCEGELKSHVDDNWFKKDNLAWICMECGNVYIFCNRCYDLWNSEDLEQIQMIEGYWYLCWKCYEDEYAECGI